MSWTVTKMSSYGAAILNASSSGTVHSVYRNTINLAFGPKLLSLHPAGVPLSPAGLITSLPADCFSRLKIEAGDLVSAGANALTFDSGTRPGEFPPLSYAEASTVELCLSKTLPEERVLSLLQSLEAGVPNWEKESTIFLPAEQWRLITFAARKQTAESELLISAGQWEAAAERLCGLIGLGIGLTPSGDDFLCGVLAGLALTGLERHPFSLCLRKQLQAGLFRTNDISRMFLRCALDGQYGEALQLFYTGSAEAILAGMKGIGHTSGIDTLCGILFLFQAWNALRDGLGVQRQEGSCCTTH